MEKIHKFRPCFKQKANFNHDFILNSDQNGFNYETKSNRTLTFRNEKHTVLAVSSKNAITHSFTLQPTISFSGKPFGKLLICLQENNNDFGIFVKKDVELLKLCKNVTVVCSRSGKITNQLINE
jgi:hypothetical protein